MTLVRSYPAVEHRSRSTNVQYFRRPDERVQSGVEFETRSPEYILLLYGRRYNVQNFRRIITI